MTDQEKCELVAREFDKLMKEHGLAGFFVACAPVHTTYAIHLETAPWMRLHAVTDKDGVMEGIRIISKRDEYLQRGLEEADAEVLQNQEMGYTINALDAISMNAGPIALLCTQVLDALRKRFTFEIKSERKGDATGA